MLKILKDRLQSLSALDKDIEVALQELKSGAVDKDDQESHVRFEGMSKDLQSYLREYQSDLKEFVNKKPEFSFEEYQQAFSQKDKKLNSMLQGYMFFRSKLA